MRALETIAQTIRLGTVHPTVVMNTLIEVENEGGGAALRLVERKLARSSAALAERSHPHSDLARTWLEATRAYLIVQAERRQAV